MSKKAILALMMALLVPVTCYFILKTASDHAVTVPRRYLLDSVTTRVENGRTITDSNWHKTGNIKLVNQLGDTVSLYDIKGKAIVADFFFTRCAGICPKLTRSMLKLQQSFLKGGDTREHIDTSIVQFLSFSIDPERDSVKVLKDYADRYGISPDNWWLLTGNKDSIGRFAFEELKVDKFSKEPVNPDFVHTSRFVLMDKEYVVRGFYNGLDSVSLSQLARDIGLLMLAKDKTQTGGVFTEMAGLKWMWVAVVLLVVAFVLYFTKKRKQNG